MIFDPSGSWLISFSAALFIRYSYLLISFISGHGDASRPPPKYLRDHDFTNLHGCHYFSFDSMVGRFRYHSTCVIFHSDFHLVRVHTTPSR
mmetsp:Transcript_30261/g.63358  ORF Transcript_30261/g.63358 Transcript_30261/m.63358 type:complete len:91 (+) Transcript_30261:36-308(+)